MSAEAEVDQERAAFLRKLDMAEVEVTDWEAKFIASCMDRTWFSPKQREIVDDLIEKYGAKIKW